MLSHNLQAHFQVVTRHKYYKYNSLDLTILLYPSLSFIFKIFISYTRVFQ